MVTSIILAILFSLSYWQYQRGKYKQALELTLNRMNKSNPLQFKELESKLDVGIGYKDLRFTKIKLTGNILANNFLIDNQVYKKIVGFRVLSPFRISTTDKFVLIDRGFIAKKDYQATLAKNFKENKNLFFNRKDVDNNNNQNLNKITDIDLDASIRIEGIINQPATGILIKEDKIDTKEFPVVLQSVNYKLISKTLNIKLLPITVQLNKNNSLAFEYVEASNPNSHNKHFSYAIQWLLLAFISIFYSVIKYLQD